MSARDTWQNGQLDYPAACEILDVGCGSGLAFLYLQRRHARKVRYYAGIDLDTRRLRERYRHAAIPHDFIDADLDSRWSLGKFDLIFI